jgi:transposase
MSPSLRDWLPEDHLAWFMLATVEKLDLDAFYMSYRADGHGRAAHDPAMMVALLLYAYACGQRSSRGIERACVEDIAFRVIAANQVPITPRSPGFVSVMRTRSPASLAACSGCARRPGWCRSG